VCVGETQISGASHTDACSRRDRRGDSTSADSMRPKKVRYLR
jgi:hypothetical protein